MAGEGQGSARPGARSGPENPFPFSSFLKKELAPYPGRISLVLRMTAAATLTMLCVMAGHLPEGALGGYFALVIARENLRASIRNALSLTAFFALAAAFVLLGAALFAGSPVTHFLWVAGSLFLLFFVLSAGANYSLAGAFSLLVTAALPTWDRPLGVNSKVALTLYLLFTLVIGSFSGLLVEAVYRSFDASSPIVAGMADRLRVSAAMLLAAGEHRELAAEDRSKLLQYAMVGPSVLRRQLIRSARSAGERARVSAAIALTGRLVELCAAALEDRGARELPDGEDARRLRAVGAAVEARASALREGAGAGSPPRWTATGAASRAVPALPEIERVAASFREVDTLDEAALEQRQREASGAAPERRGFRLFKPDAFRNREHLAFALRGCLAATLCYIFYLGVNWPGIDTALRTCTITALATIGSSRQKQVLRIAGAVLGGFGIALPAQVYLLPRIDSITGFALFFAAVSLPVAWLATSSPRLSYFGLQAALAFYLVNLQEPYEQLSLAVSRDRVVGVLLGLMAMWLVFDRLGATDAAARMEALLRANLLRIGDYGLLAAELSGGANGALQARAQAMRVEINDAFSQMNAQADAVLFEWGPRREHRLRARGRMQAMQPAMRAIFLAELILSEAGPARDSGSAALPMFFARSRDVLQLLAAGPPAGAQGSAEAMEKLREALAVLKGAQDGASGPTYSLCEGLVRSLGSLRIHAFPEA